MNLEVMNLMRITSQVALSKCYWGETVVLRLFNKTEHNVRINKYNYFKYLLHLNIAQYFHNTYGVKQLAGTKKM